MASRSKQKTTMAKLNRERALQQRRLEKQARKDARRQAASEPAPEGGAPEEAAADAWGEPADRPPHESLT
jgi:hypothetical protein